MAKMLMPYFSPLALLHCDVTHAVTRGEEDEEGDKVEEVEGINKIGRAFGPF